MSGKKTKMAIDLMPVPGQDFLWAWRITIGDIQAAYAKGTVTIKTPVTKVREDLSNEDCWNDDEEGTRIEDSVSELFEATLESIEERVSANDFNLDNYEIDFYFSWPGDPETPEMDELMLGWLDTQRKGETKDL